MGQPDLRLVRALFVVDLAAETPDWIYDVARNAGNRIVEIGVGSGHEVEVQSHLRGGRRQVGGERKRDPDGQRAHVEDDVCHAVEKLRIAPHGGDAALTTDDGAVARVENLNVDHP